MVLFLDDGDFEMAEFFVDTLSIGLLCDTFATKYTYIMYNF